MLDFFMLTRANRVLYDLHLLPITKLISSSFPPFLRLSFNKQLEKNPSSSINHRSLVASIQTPLLPNQPMSGFWDASYITNRRTCNKIWQNVRTIQKKNTNTSTTSTFKKKKFTVYFVYLCIKSYYAFKYLTNDIVVSSHIMHLNT